MSFLKTKLVHLPNLLFISNQFKLKSPIIINADVFQGAKSAPPKFDPTSFVNQSLNLYPNGIISLGWTTNDNILTNYTWSDMFQAYNLLKNLNLLSANSPDITFAVRALWSTKSVHRLHWLTQFTKSTLTIFSVDTDQLSSLESLLLFRKFFINSSVYYDLPKKQQEFFKLYAYDPAGLDNVLSKSSDLLIKSYLKNSNFLSDFWTSVHGTILQSSFAALMLNNGASFVSRKQYKAKDNVDIYELSGKFEIFSTLTKQQESLVTPSALNNNNNNNMSSLNENNDNNLAVLNSMADQSSCVRVSLRSSSSIPIYDSLKANFESHSPGSINIYIFTNGLIKIFVGNKLEQEANLHPAASNFE